ncbi:MAG: nucleotidyltransferase domain-containing protein [Pseudomonadota bacterium]
MKSSTKLRDEIVKAKARAREARRLEYLGRVMSVLDRFSVHRCFDEAFVFGSVAREGGFDGASDIDIAFSGLRDEDVIMATAYLSNELGVDVDVVRLEGHRFADKIRTGGVKWKKRK